MEAPPVPAVQAAIAPSSAYQLPVAPLLERRPLVASTNMPVAVAMPLPMAGGAWPPMPFGTLEASAARGPVLASVAHAP